MNNTTSSSNIDLKISQSKSLPEDGYFDLKTTPIIGYSSVTEELATICEAEFGIPHVGSRDNFSMFVEEKQKLEKVCLKIESRWGLKVTPSQLLAERDICTFCENYFPQHRHGDDTIVEQHVTKPMTVEPGIEDQDCTAGQRWLWYLDQFIENPGINHVSRLVDIHGSLYPHALQDALQVLAQRYSLLNSCLKKNQSGVQFVANQSIQVELPITDLTLMQIEAAFRIAKREAISRASERIDLYQAPLWRCYLWCVDRNRFLFLIVAHRLILDESALKMLINELSYLYQAQIQNHRSKPKLSPRQFQDYLLDLYHWKKTDDFQSSLEFWKSQLQPPLPVLQLPFAKPRPRQPKWMVSTVRKRIPQKLLHTLSYVFAKDDQNSEEILISVLQLLFYRYTQHRDILLGWVRDQRSRYCNEELVAPIETTAIIRCQLDPSERVIDFIGKQFRYLNDVRRHDRMPLELLIENHPVTLDAGKPLIHSIEVAFTSLKNYPTRFANSACQIVRVDSQPNLFDLYFTFEEQSDGSLHLITDFQEDLFSLAQIERLQSHFLNLLEAAVDNPYQSIAELPILSAVEFKKTVEEWNDTRGAFPAEKRINELFVAQAQSIPEAIALVTADEQLTYEQLLQKVNHLQKSLRFEGIGPGDRIGIYLTRSPRMIISVLAVLQLGAIYVPIDSTYPRERIEFTLNDSGIQIVLTESVLLDKISNPQIRFVCLDKIDWDEPTEINNIESENLATSIKPSADDLAYIIYTSGSTGKPKGVMVRHREVINILDWMNSTFGIGQRDRVLFVTSLSFDLSVYDIFGTLAAGGSIRIASEQELKDPVSLVQILYNEPVTIWDSAPAALQQLVPFLSQISSKKELKKLRYVFLSGDWIPVALPDQIRAYFNTQMISLGGATEATIWSNWYRIEHVDPTWTSIPYGKPIRNARYYILDDRQRPVPIGIPGELYIGGEVLAQGYWQREELTAERFLADPFVPVSAENPQPKMYRTGDLARFLEDGNIEFLGRIDHQVKIRGFRVELGEIEVVLLKHPAIREGVVCAHRDNNGHNFLVAYVVLHSEDQISQEEIKTHCRQFLPEQMVPAQIVIQKSLPLSANGKIDRQALKPLLETRTQSSKKYVPPANDTERALQAVWEEVFGIVPISVESTFIDLGGHSLLAAVLAARVESKMGHRIPLDAVINAASIRQLSLILQRKLELGRACLVPLQRQGERPPLIMIAGAGGHVFTFHKFSRLLFENQPVYGLKAVGVDGLEITLENIRDIASRYKAEILLGHPNKSYVISGYSIGGIIAFELALQLQDAGVEVPRIIIFDMFAPGYPKPLPIWKRCWMHFKNFCTKPGMSKVHYVCDRLNGIKRRYNRWLNRHDRNAPIIENLDVVPQDTLRKVWGSLSKARDRYWPERLFRGKIVLINSNQTPDWAATVFDDPCYGWSRWSSHPIQTFHVNAGHLELFSDQQIEVVASQVRQILSEIS